MWVRRPPNTANFWRCRGAREGEDCSLSCTLGVNQEGGHEQGQEKAHQALGTPGAKSVPLGMWGFLGPTATSIRVVIRQSKSEVTFTSSLRKQIMKHLIQIFP